MKKHFNLGLSEQIHHNYNNKKEYISLISDQDNENILNQKEIYRKLKYRNKHFNK